jgi:hypothetical protein
MRSLGQSAAFELSSWQLCLQVNKSSFDFDRHHLIGPGQEEVGRPPVASRHWRLEASGPASVQDGHDGFGQTQLPRVAERDAVDRVEADAQLMADRRRQATTRNE